jgi:aminoacrylate hydrolase
MSAELRYTVHGAADSPPVLFSAGLGGTASYWKPQIAALGPAFRAVLYDQRGTGENPGPPNQSIAEMAADCAAILAETGPAHFVGHALGGLIGLELAIRHPGLLRSLAVVNAWARLDTHTARCFAVRRRLLDAGGPAAYVQAQPIFLYPSAWLSAHADLIAAEEAHGLAHFQGRDTLLARIGALQSFDCAARMAAIRTPTLIIAARDDVLVPYTCSETLAAGIAGATLRILPSGGTPVT